MLFSSELPVADALQFVLFSVLHGMNRDSEGEGAFRFLHGGHAFVVFEPHMIDENLPGGAFLQNREDGGGVEVGHLADDNIRRLLFGGDREIRRIAPVEIALITFAPLIFCSGYGLLFSSAALVLGLSIMSYMIYNKKKSKA